MKEQQGKTEPQWQKLAKKIRPEKVLAFVGLILGGGGA